MPTREYAVCPPVRSNVLHVGGIGEWQSAGGMYLGDSTVSDTVLVFILNMIKHEVRSRSDKAETI